MMKSYAKFIWVSLGMLGACQTNLKGPTGDAPAITSQLQAEALAIVKRPDFSSDLTNRKRIVITASKDQPKRVSIQRRLYENKENTYMDITIAGPGGLDEGTPKFKTIYYLYGVPHATQENIFSLIASEKGPQTGPKNFSSHTYLGAFITTDFGVTNVVEIAPCVKIGDLVQIQSEQLSMGPGFEPQSLTFEPVVPTHSTAVQLRLDARGVVFKSAAKAYAEPTNSQSFTANEISAAGPISDWGDVLIAEVSTYSQEGWIPFLATRRIVVDAGIGQIPDYSVQSTVQVTGWVDDVSKWP